MYMGVPQPPNVEEPPLYKGHPHPLVDFREGGLTKQDAYQEVLYYVVFVSVVDSNA